MVEEVGFEPTIPFGMPVFKTGAFNRSATPPIHGNSCASSQDLHTKSAYAMGIFSAFSETEHLET